jgi:hypothetical protein
MWALGQLLNWYCAQMERAQDFHNSALRLMSHSPQLAAQDQHRADYHYARAREYMRKYTELRNG